MHRKIASGFGIAWLMVAGCVQAVDIHWGYGGDEHGPEHWGSMDETYAICDSGKRQSPINIVGTSKVVLPPVEFSYGALPVDIWNNGHTIQVAANGSIRFNGLRYQLLQLHFHTPSEESVAGRRYELVAHLVHRDEAGRLAVVAILFEEGTKNTVLETVWAHMPRAPGERHAAVDEQFDLPSLLPKGRDYYSYEGSLTTPPCSEGVTWIVFREPVQLSREQLDAFRQLYSDNARPLQPANGRQIFIGHEGPVEIKQ